MQRWMLQLFCLSDPTCQCLCERGTARQCCEVSGTLQYQMQHKHDMTEATIDVEAKEQKQQMAVREDDIDKLGKD